MPPQRRVCSHGPSRESGLNCSVRSLSRLEISLVSPGTVHTKLERARLFLKLSRLRYYVSRLHDYDRLGDDGKPRDPSSTES